MRRSETRNARPLIGVALFIMALHAAPTAAAPVARAFSAANVEAGGDASAGCLSSSDGRNSGGDNVNRAESVASIQGTYLPSDVVNFCSFAFSSYSGSAVAIADLYSGELKVSAAIRGAGFTGAFPATASA